MRLLILGGVSSLGAVLPPRGLSVPGSTYNSRVRAVVKYLVTKRLAGDVKTLLAVKEVLVDWVPPSDAAAKHGIGSRYKVRGYVQRVIEKAGNERFAKAIIEKVWEPIYFTDPIVVKVGDRWLCLACGKVVPFPEPHVRKYHKPEIEAATDAVLAKLDGGW